MEHFKVTLVDKLSAVFLRIFKNIYKTFKYRIIKINGDLNTFRTRNTVE